MQIMTATTYEKIKKLEATGLSISDISRLTGVPQPTVWRIANRKHANPLENTAHKIDRLFKRELCSGVSKKPGTAA